MRKYTAASTALAAALLVAMLCAGCPDETADPPVEPTPPVYPAVTATELIAAEGGTGGGPNMGSVVVTLFDDEDDSRIAGATVILRHGGTQVSEVMTDAEGCAAFSQITPGSYSFTAVKASYVNLTVVDLNAASVALPMAKRSVEVAGNVTGVSILGTRLTMDFAAKTRDEFDGETVNKYGAVTRLEAGSGSTWNYVLRLTTNVTDSLVVSEVDSGTGKIVNRQVTPLGPYTDDEGLNFSMPASPATGLHWVQINATGIRTGATRVEAVFEENLVTYKSYSASDGGGGSWTILLQMPPDRTGAQITIDTYMTTNPDDKPAESFRFSYSSLSADNTAPSNASVNVDMVAVSGDITTGSGATAFLVETHYNGKSHISLGLPLPTADDYAVRIPRNTAVDFRVVGLVNPGAESLGQMAAHFHEAMTPQSSDIVKDVSLTATSSLSVTAPITANMPDPEAFCAFSGPYADGKYIGMPFISNGQAGASDMTFDARYSHISGITYVFVVQAKDGSDPARESICLRGNLTDVATQIGSSLTLDLLDVPRLLSPVQSAVVNRDSLFLTWDPDPDIAADGYANVKILDADGGEVWNVIARGSTLQVRLHKLPPLLSGLDLQNNIDYTSHVETARVQGLAFDSFTLDVFPSESADMVAQTNPVYIAKGPGNTFRVN